MAFCRTKLTPGVATQLPARTWTSAEEQREGVRRNLRGGPGQVTSRLYVVEQEIIQFAHIYIAATFRLCAKCSPVP
jgi:hypothetical protein